MGESMGARFGRIVGGSCATGKRKFSTAAVGARVAAVRSFYVELRGRQEARFIGLCSLRLHITFVGVVAAPFTNSQPELSGQTFHPNCERVRAAFLHASVNFSLYGPHAHPSTAGASGSGAAPTCEAPEKSSGQRVAT